MSTITESTKRLSKKEWSNLTNEQKATLRKEKIAAGQEAFDEAIASLVEGDEFREALRAAAMCHTYSFRNLLWVIAQRRNFQGPVASYNDWKNKLGYQVRKGERGAMIWVPVQIKIKVKAKVENDPDEAEDEIRATRFKIGKVFTRDQVDPIEGKALELDMPRPEPVNGDSHADLIPLLTKYITDKLGWKFRELDAANSEGALGWCDATNKEIAIRIDQPANAQVRTTIHELIHAVGSVGYKKYGRELAETVTESAAFLVCRSIGLDVSESSVPYVVGWSAKDLDAVKREIQWIGSLADQLLTESGLDKHLALSEAEAVMAAS